MSEDGRGRAVADPTELWRQWFETGTRAWSDFFKMGREGYTDPYGLYRQWFSGLEEMRSRMVGGPTWKAPGGATGMEGRSQVEASKPVPAVNPLANAGVEGVQNLWRQWYEAVSDSARRSVSLGTEVAGMWPRWFETLEQVRTNLSSVENVPTDPLQVATQWYNATSGPLSELVADLVEREEFLEPSSRLLQNYASFYKVFKRNSEEYLRNLQIPVREDVTRVAALVVALDEKVDNLEEAFEDFEDGFVEPASAESATAIEERIAGLEDKLDGAAAASAEARDGAATAESVEGLGGRLDRVEDKLDQLLAALQGPSRNGDAQVEPALSEAPQEALPVGGAETPSGPSEEPPAEPWATSAARRKAGELGVDLGGIEGTGSGGQITVDDVRRAEGDS
ncbi:MAG TPA: E3 binding domain-containing protein [Rubrobacteraceae bacterium]|nr:E3 binding domain-containing protein [Rubrobacteraceae bacterium]